jgi:hypothetical protein
MTHTTTAFIFRDDGDVFVEVVAPSRGGDDSASAIAGLMIPAGLFQLTRTGDGSYCFRLPTGCTTNALLNYHSSVLYDHTWRSDDIRIGQRDFEHRCDIEQIVSFDDSNGRQIIGEHPVRWIVIVDVQPNVGASTSASLDTHGATIVGGLHMEDNFRDCFS